LSTVAVACLLLLFSLSVRAADPSSAVYSNDAERIFWIMHISDTHIGTEWYDEDSRFFWALREALPIIQPELVINGGDLIDASIAGVPASGQVEEEWSRYREIVDISGLPADFYIDIPGNHDLYGDSWLSYYLQWSLSGSTYNTTTRSLDLSFPFGNYFIYTCATPGDEAKPFTDTKAFSPDELDEMQSQLSAHDGDELILVFGHHRPDQPDNADQARAMWRQHGAIYFHGHSHEYDAYVNEGVLAYEVNSLGKSKQDNLAVIAVDNNYIAYAVTDSDDPWPFILVTAPADRVLHSGEANPYAYQVCNTGENNPVRVLVFDRQPVTAVHFSVDGGESVAMTRDAELPVLWHGSWDTRGLAAGDVSLAVSAEGTKARGRTITVSLADVSCPEPYQPPDGGMQDADGGIADPGPDAGQDANDDAGTTADSGESDGGEANDEGHPAGGGCGCSTDRKAGGLSFVLLFCLLALLTEALGGILGHRLCNGVGE